MPDDFKSLNEILLGDEHFDKMRKAVKNFDVVERFAEVFPELTAFTAPVKVSKEVLYLRVENSAWRAELNYNQKIMIEKINNFFCEKVIKSIKFLA